MKEIAEFFANLFNLLFFNNKYKKIKVAEHPFFNRMDLLISSVDYKLEFKNNKGREKIIEDILNLKFHYAFQELYEFAQKIDKKKENINVRECFWNHIMKHTKEYVNINNYRKFFSDIDKEDEELLKIVIKKFNKWHSEDLNNLRERAEDIKNAKYLEGNIVKSSALLDHCSSFFNNTLKSAQVTLKNLDGEISGRVYRGVEIKKLNKDEFKERINKKCNPEFKVFVRDMEMYCRIKIENFKIENSLINKKLQLYNYNPEEYTKVKIHDISKNGIALYFKDPSAYNIFLLNKSQTENVLLDFSKDNCEINLILKGEITGFTKNRNMLGVKFICTQKEKGLLSDWIATLSLLKQDINIENQNFKDDLYE